MDKVKHLLIKPKKILQEEENGNGKRSHKKQKCNGSISFFAAGLGKTTPL